ncbi:ATP-binding cassette domain-containing protein [Stakelama sp. CBK3Z-3]|uniref:ATP-binding cassette domain-containing protein n=1 Tax=Stakelama flava TaxID=2860338 RepID=A0ABS6XMX4_9SPHN|nr:ATP-binding cassette domain-containing protein [Stakelama flava]MBW4331567.1 ATP-binding cassette domain-containing protein [Stakelama flava]
MNRDLIETAIRGRTGSLIRYAFICALFAGLSSVLLLALSGWFLTAAAIAGAGGAAVAAAFNYLIPSAAIRALAIIRTGSRYGERLLSHRAALTAMADWRGRLFGKLAAQDTRIAPDLSGGDASARLIGDIEALEDLVVRRPTRPASLASAAFAVALTFLAGWQAALALAVLLALLPFILKHAATRWTREPAAEAAAALGDLRAAFVEAAAARPEIISYGIADRVTDELALAAARVDRANAALFRGEGHVAGLLVGYGTIAAAAVLVLASSPAALMALGLLAATASVEAMAAFARTAVRQASVEQGLDRLSLLATLKGEPVKAQAVRDDALTVTLGKAVIAPGERIAIVGASGSGKTQLIEALAGLRAPVHPLAVADMPVADCSQSMLTGQFALAPQEPTLLAGTIADNLRLARPGLDDSHMAEALHVACLDERIATMPDGLDMVIGEGGGTLSGGERKRLSLARALLAGRPWLVLDEPTEGLDAATEALLVSRLGGWLDSTGTGLILVSHRRAPLALATHQVPIAMIADSHHG